MRAATPQGLCFLPGSRSRSGSGGRAWLGGCLGSRLMRLSTFGAPHRFSVNVLCSASRQQVPQPDSGQPGTHIPKPKVWASLVVKCHWAHFIPPHPPPPQSRMHITSTDHTSSHLGRWRREREAGAPLSRTEGQILFVVVVNPHSYFPTDF